MEPRVAMILGTVDSLSLSLDAKGRKEGEEKKRSELSSQLLTESDDESQ
jgi:hypothetical protein